MTSNHCVEMETACSAIVSWPVIVAFETENFYLSNRSDPSVERFLMEAK